MFIWWNNKEKKFKQSINNISSINRCNEIYIIWIYVNKPENILFAKNNKIKLIDYGLSFCYKNTLINIFIFIIFFTFAFDLP